MHTKMKKKLAYKEFLLQLETIGTSEGEQNAFSTMEFRIWADARARDVSLIQAFLEIQEVGK